MIKCTATIALTDEEMKSFVGSHGMKLGSSVGSHAGVQDLKSETITFDFFSLLSLVAYCASLAIATLQISQMAG